MLTDDLICGEGKEGRDKGVNRSRVVLTEPFQVNGEYIGQSMNCELLLCLGQLLTAADKPT